MPEGAHLLVGDGHYVGAPDEATRWGRLLAAAAARGATEISVLGDFFELWLGLAGLEEPWQEALFAPLYALKRGGVRLRYVVGNKDYFVQAWNARHQLFDEVVDPGCVVPSPLGPLHLAHGDLVNSHDRQYRAWRRLSRSPPLTWLMRALPRPWLASLSARVARRLQDTNRYHKSYFPEAQLRAQARALPPGPAILVFGHFHVHRQLVDADKQVITLPFLGGENAGILIDRDGARRLEAV